MHIRKYDFDYSRRKMMQNVALGLGGGVLAPVWPTIAATGEVTKAYPDELTSIEVNTKGKIKVGDTIDSSNVEHVKHLLDPIFFEQISNPWTQGQNPCADARRFRAVPARVFRSDAAQCRQGQVRRHRQRG